MGFNYGLVVVKPEVNISGFLFKIFFYSYFFPRGLTIYLDSKTTTMFESNYQNFGVIQVIQTQIKIYKDLYSYMIINVGRPIMSAIWSNGVLNVRLSDGSVRRYSGPYSYTELR